MADTLAMFLRSVSRVLLSIFEVKGPLDFVLRPGLMLIGIAALNLTIKWSFTDQTNRELLVDTALTVLVGLPFVAMCFALLLYQADQKRNLSTEALTDDLTGLPNRRAFFYRATNALEAHRTGFFLIIDADKFKSINDTLGHPVGDICLQAVANRIDGLLREDDLVGRIGGEEFGAVLFDRTEADLQRISGRLCFPIHVNLNGHVNPLRLTVSAGATMIGANDTIEALTARADEALLAAKNNGRERVVLWRPADQAA